jgi:uncharacterized membrane protein
MVEAWINVFVGFGISFACNMTILPWFGFEVSARQSFEIGLIMTVVSLVRSYLLRRLFNSMKWGHR